MNSTNSLMGIDIRPCSQNGLWNGANSPSRSRPPQVALREVSRVSMSSFIDMNLHPSHGYLPSLSWLGVLNRSRNAHCAV